MDKHIKSSLIANGVEVLEPCQLLTKEHSFEGQSCRCCVTTVLLNSKVCVLAYVLICVLVSSHLVTCYNMQFIKKNSEGNTWLLHNAHAPDMA
jgi:hypothetical protein